MTFLYEVDEPVPLGQFECRLCSTGEYKVAHAVETCPIVVTPEMVEFGRLMALTLWDHSGELPC